ncbi:uncharacterized protein METZ01_LOCUS474147, partial [marine metagenome]
MKNSALKLSQIQQYNENGFLSPIDILNLDEVRKLRDEIEFIEKKWSEQINGLNRNNIHYYSPIFDQLVHNYKILDVVENFIGS